MAELFDKEDDGDEEEQELQVMQDEEDEDGLSSNHTLKLASANIAIKSEILCLAFSDDGRWVRWASEQLVYCCSRFVNT